jgi:hypothetical protein
VTQTTLMMKTPTTLRMKKRMILMMKPSSLSQTLGPLNVVRTGISLMLAKLSLTFFVVDHVVELQLLKKTLQSNGVCGALDAIIATPNSGLFPSDKELYLASIKDTINGKNNLFFLDKKLNQVVRLYFFSTFRGTTLTGHAETRRSHRVTQRKTTRHKR